MTRLDGHWGRDWGRRRGYGVSLKINNFWSSGFATKIFGGGESRFG